MDKVADVMTEYFKGKRAFVETVDDACQLLEEEINLAIQEYYTKRNLQVEISLAHPDDDEFEHEGYYDTIDDAINALIELKNKFTSED